MPTQLTIGEPIQLLDPFEEKLLALLADYRNSKVPPPPPPPPPPANGNGKHAKPNDRKVWDDGEFGLVYISKDKQDMIYALRVHGKGKKHPWGNGKHIENIPVSEGLETAIKRAKEWDKVVNFAITGAHAGLY